MWARCSMRLVTILGLLLCVVQAFGSSARPSQSHFLTPRRTQSPHISLLTLRGGADSATIESADVEEPTTKTTNMAASIASSASLVASLGKFYSSSLSTHPILTKSVTASLIFGLSDFLAQKLENAKKDAPKYNKTRTIVSMAVGLLYFGPAAHAWYDMIFKVFPGTGLLSTLQKAAMGQIFFGPSFTCIFFATALWQSNQFTLRNWVQKIKNDLPGAWLAGVGFWPLVDLISYSFFKMEYIPLFVNMCSLVWTIYLSVVANRGSESRTE